MKRNAAQTLLEYVILIGIISMAILAMGPMFKRSIQATIKITADQLAPQNEAEQNIDEQSGYLINAFTRTRTHQDKQLIEAPGGGTRYIYGDQTQTTTETYTDLGFTNRND